MSSTCEQATNGGNDRLWRDLLHKITNQRIPFSGTLALTHRCNLGCLHCYAKGEAAHTPAETELSTEQWLDIITQIREAGCLFLLLSGGDPLLREDFPEIYAHAKRSGFLVTVFTNGTLVSDRIIDLFRELPPRLVEISIYGATAALHDRVTGSVGSFSRTMQAIDELIGQGIRVGLKTILMTLNQQELSAMENLAQRYGVKFRHDAAIFPALGGDRSPLDLRVPPEQAVAYEFSHPERVREWREFYEHYRNFTCGKSLYICGAGTRTFHIDPGGWLYPCMMVREHRYFLPAGSFEQGWNGEIASVQEEEIDPGSPCAACAMKVICGYCPGFFRMESGSSQVESKYLCAIGKFRYSAITDQLIGG